METDMQSDGMDSDFHRWQHLTDVYAEQLEALRRREPGASAELMRISRELEKFSTGFQELEDLVRLQRKALAYSRAHRPRDVVH